MRLRTTKATVLHKRRKNMETQSFEDSSLSDPGTQHSVTAVFTTWVLYIQNHNSMSIQHTYMRQTDDFGVHSKLSLLSPLDGSLASRTTLDCESIHAYNQWNLTDSTQHSTGAMAEHRNPRTGKLQHASFHWSYWEVIMRLLPSMDQRGRNALQINTQYWEEAAEDRW